MMNVLVFTSLFPNNQSPNHGIFIQQRLKHSMARHGWIVKVVAPVPYYPPGLGGWRATYRKVAGHEVREGMEVWHPRYVMIPKIGMMLQGLLLFVSVCWKVRALQRSFPFALIDAHYVYPDGFAAALLSWITGVPVVVSARGTDVNLFKNLPIIRQLITWTLRKADAVIVVSEALRQISIELGVDEKKIRVIPNGVNPEKFFSIPQAEARKKIGFSREGQSLVLSVCHLNANKGLDVLLHALALLSEKASTLLWSLYVVGEGVERERLECLVQSLDLSERVRFCGEVPHEQLVWFYNAADVCCLLSEREGWPNVIVESLACGTPVLATSVGGIPEIVTSPKVGTLVARKPEHVATALKTSLERTWSKSEILKYAQQFRWSQTADAVKEVFQFVLTVQGTTCRKHFSSGS
ncbi:MAG: glycosyltransferase family 4 protein [Nitrospirales bacterium]|nr:glycosyltransferase family 4 protein [Nitrospirales bacterium]